MVLVCLFCVFMCQTIPVLPDGIAPIPPSAYKSSLDPRTLPNLQLNACPEALPYIPPGTLIESNKPPVTSPESCIIQEAFDLTSAPKPFTTVSISAPIVDPYLQTDLQIQSFSPNIGITPQTLAIPPISLSNLKSCDFVKSNVPLNDCAQKAPPTIQKVPAYFVTSKEDCLKNSNVPITTIKLDNFPNNIYKVKVGDSKPIFIDCSKQTNIYKSPVTLTPVNTVEIQNLGSPNPNSQVIPNLIVEPNQPNQINEFILQTTPVKILQDNPVVPIRSNDITINEPCINTCPAIDQTNAETKASTDKILYPINNVKFNFGPNLFNPIQNACPEKIQPVIPPKLVPIDNNVVAVASPVNIVPNIPSSTQCDILPEYCYCNNVNLLPKSEPTKSFPPCAFNPAPISCNEELSIPIPQLPNVNTITTIPIQPSILASPISKPIYETSPDSFTSGLSYSLNNIVSLLTTGLLSKVFGTSSDKAVPDIVPIEICDAVSFKEPILDVIPSINIDIPCASCIPLVTCPFVESSPPSPNPLIAVELKESDSQSNAKITSALCTEKSKLKPYIASVTINITPSTDTPNDIIIVV